MASYFLDTSAIIKHYFLEPGHAWIENLYRPVEKHDIYISQIALVEVLASICRKAHEQNLVASDRDTLINTFRRDSQKIYGLQRVTVKTYIAAGNLCRTYRLRAYDAMQLAGVISLNEKAVNNKAPLPIFVCADNQLVTIAITEGLSVENPNSYA